MGVQRLAGSAKRECAGTPMSDTMQTFSGSPWSHRAFLRHYDITEAVDVQFSCFCCPYLKRQGQQNYFCVNHHIKIVYPTIYGCQQMRRVSYG